MAPPEPPLVLETTTGSETLDDVQRLLDELWSTHDVSDVVRMHVDLAVGEIAANIVEHSGAGRPVHLRMAAEWLPDAVRVTFHDDGHVTPTEVGSFELPDAMSERGRGLAIAHRVLDELAYRRDGNGNHWTLIRHRDG